MSPFSPILKVEDGDVSKSSGSLRSKKPVTKMVMEYCYEPEMEEVLPAISSKKLKVFLCIWHSTVFIFLALHLYIYIYCLIRKSVVFLRLQVGSFICVLCYIEQEVQCLASVHLFLI